MTEPTRSTRWLSWCGMETHLIFDLGVDLPGFASFPLLNTDRGCKILRKLYTDQIAVAAETGCGASLEAVTWMANADRAQALGYSVKDLVSVNHDAIAFLKGMEANVPLRISAQVGPRGDGYAAGEMTADTAQTYHSAQIETLADAGADLISAYTIGAVDEAKGIVRAAASTGIPVILSFTVETDGVLPDGTDLADAMARVDGATDGAATGFAVNCAHPDHLARALLRATDWNRLIGIVANASRQSHAELDEATELDNGDATELGAQIGKLAREHPQLTLFGGCCGTDTRHLRAIGHAVTA